MNNINISAKLNVKKIVIMAGIALIYLLIFSGYTSPLYTDYYEWDSPFFMLVGKMINSGAELYTDVFDDKGPVIFFINSIGLSIAGRTGVFILQWLFLCADIFISCMIVEVLGTSTKTKYSALAGTLVFWTYSLSNGNTCEEYNLPFILLSFYFLLKDVKSAKPMIRHSLIYGIGIAICALTRLTNGVSIFAIALFWIIYLIKENRISELLMNLLAGVVGIAVIFIPVSINYMLKGSFDEMIFDVFIINFSYASNSAYINGIKNLSIIVHMLINFSPLLIAIIVFWVKINDLLLKFALVLVTVCNIPVLLLGGGYNHYFAIIMPIVLCMLAVAFDSFFTKSFINVMVVAMMIMYTVLAVRVIVVNVRECYISLEYTEEFKTVKNDFQSIPNEERNSVLGFSMVPRYYLIGDILPCFKYCAFQDIWFNEIPQIRDEMEKFIKTTPPCWIVVEDDYNNAWLQGIIDAKYELKLSDKYCRMYRIRGNK